MPKVLIANSNITIKDLRNLTPRNIIAWFDCGCFNINSRKVLKWKSDEPLISSSDESINILTQGNEFYIIPVADIVRVENLSSETSFFLESGDFFTTRYPFKMLEEELKKHLFFLIHPNHLININHLKKFVQCNAFVTLSNSDTIPVSIGNDQTIADFLNKQTIL